MCSVLDEERVTERLRKYFNKLKERSTLHAIWKKSLNKKKERHKES